MTVPMIAALFLVVAAYAGHLLGEIPIKHNGRAIAVACILFGVIVFVFSNLTAPITHLLALLVP